MGFPKISTRRLFRVVNGGTPTSDPKNWDGGIKWATPVDLASVNGGFISDTQRTITPIGLASGSCSVPSASIIISTRAPIGYVAETVTDTAFNQGCRGLVPRVGVDTRFFRYYYLAIADNLAARGLGSTFMELSGDSLAETKISAPPLGVQRGVADYLDVETARIDTLIAKKCRLVDLLRLRFWASIVSMSLNTGADHVPLRRAFSFIVDGPFGSAFSSADYTLSGVAVVRLGNIGFAEYKPVHQAYIPMNLFEKFQRHRVYKGDLLIAGLGDDSNHAGRACVSPDLGDAIVKGKCFSARADPSRASARYLAYILSSPAGAEAVGLSARGSTRSMINLGIIKSTIIPLPSVEVQRSIADFADTVRLRTDRTVNALEQQIAFLRERRQKLITAAVTGEMDVPGVPA